MQLLPRFTLSPAIVLLVLGVLAPSLHAANWPSWRGPHGDGTSPERNVPLTWSATENVRWKIELPEPGDSSPVVWEDKVFITQAREATGGRTVMCFNRRDGKLLWQQGTTWTQKEKRYGQNPYCAASPVTDGERVIAFFGSAGLLCWDMNGKELWRRDLGKHEHEWAYAASPLIHGDVCVLYFGPGLNARLLGLDKRLGKTLWEAKEPAPEARPRTDGFKGQERGGMVGTFTTPIIVRAGQRDELIQTFPQFVRAFDPRSGRPLWHCDGLNELVYSSPIAGEGVLVGMGGYFGTSLAVKTGGTGDVTATHRLWQTVRTKNRLGTGVITGGHVFILNTEGIAECLNLQTGASLWQERVKGSGSKGDSWSSMVLVDGHILCLNQGGETLVLKASPKFELVRVNSLDGALVNSSHAISNGEIFIRTQKHLWCIGRP
jgi:outer membrane protein assembly factor BamB